MRTIGAILAAAAILLGSATADARPAPGTPRARAAKVAKDDLIFLTDKQIGNLGALITNYGRFGDAATARQSSMEWPMGSGNDYLYEGRLWFGAMVGDTTRVSQGDDPLEWGTDPTSTDEIQEITGDQARGDYDTYCEFTDGPGNSNPLGIRVKQRTSTWTISYLDDIILYDMTFSYQGESESDTLRECYVGVAMDADVSSLEGSENYLDDLTYWTRYSTASGERFISYEYDNDHPQIPGNDVGGPEGQSKGYIGTSPLLIIDASGNILPAIPHTHFWWDWNHDPGSDELRYDYMASGQFLATPPSPFDYRYLQAYGPFDIPAGKSIRIVFVHAMGEGLAGLKENVDAIHDLFQTNRTVKDGKWAASGPPASPAIELRRGDGRVTVRWGADSETHKDPVTGVADFAGYRVWRSPTGVEGTWTLLADYDKLDDYGLNSGLPSQSDGKYEFVDSQVHNGFGYFYAVTVYDKGDLGLVGSLESSQNTNKAQVVPGPTGDDTGENIYVYPNPYRFQALWDPTPGAQRPESNQIAFNNIPGRCTINVYTMSGDLITTLEHTDGTGFHLWNLMSDRAQTQKIVSGVYLYSVRGEGVNYVDKFVILR